MIICKRCDIPLNEYYYCWGCDEYKGNGEYMSVTNSQTKLKQKD